MTDMNLNELTVLELRKVAKEMKVPLSAGISKAGIIERLTAAMAAQSAPEAEPTEKAAPMQEVMALPFIITVQQPQAPWSQPILAPVSWRRSRRV